MDDYNTKQNTGTYSYQGDNSGTSDTNKTYTDGGLNSSYTQQRRATPPAFTVPGNPSSSQSQTVPGASAAASSAQRSSSAAAPKKEPLKSPRSRPTISTNRIFSPYDFSFFDDAITTRELNDSERNRIAKRQNASASGTQSQKRSVQNQSSSGGRILTPETNVYPSADSSRASAGSPSFSSTQTTRPSAANRPAASANTSAGASSMNNSASRNSSVPPAFNPSQQQSSKSYGSQILTTDNNLFPEDKRSIRNTMSQQSGISSAKTASAFTYPSASSASSYASPAHSSAKSVSSASAPSNANTAYARTASSSNTQMISKRPAPSSATPAFTVSSNAKTAATAGAAAASTAAIAQRTAASIPSSMPAFNTAATPAFKAASSSQKASAKSPSVSSAASPRPFEAVSSAPASPTQSTRVYQPAEKPVTANSRTAVLSNSNDAKTISFAAMKEASIPSSASGSSATASGSGFITDSSTKSTSFSSLDLPKKQTDSNSFSFSQAALASALSETTRLNSAEDTAKQNNSGFITGSNAFKSVEEQDQGKTVALNTNDVKSLDQPKKRRFRLFEEVEEEEEDLPAEQTAKKKTKKRIKKTASDDVTSQTDMGGPNDPDDPSGTSPSKPEGPKRWFVILTAVLVVAVFLELVVGITGIVMISNMAKGSPDLNLTDFVGEESTKIYDDQGELVTEVGVYLRQNITYDHCPESLVDAFLSVEDSRFFSHFGFDIPRFTKALIDNLKTMSFGQGGSTFTMQLVKNTYFSVESMNAEDTGTERVKSIEYKVQQIYLAIKLEHLLSKKEIFTLYLNKLNFGGNIRGVQRASQYYFGKNSNELTLSESAMLAGIVNLPNRYNPYDYLDYGTTRRNEVLQLMKYHGYITEEELQLAKAIKVENTLVGDIREATEDSEYQSYIDVVLEEAMEITGSDPTVKGMNIYTHLNREMQEEVEAIQNSESSVAYPDDLMQVAMISMDNRTGAIVAVGGGRNYDGARLLNRATMNYKQPGSSVKPLLSYALAFEYLGYSLEEVLLDKPITYPMESMVLVNASGNYAGDVTIKDAVGNSLNIPAIITLERVVNKIGVQKVVEYLNTIGFSRVTQEGFHLSYAIGGTTFETTCKELAGAHAMLINKGVYNKPHTIEKIVMSSDGSEYYPGDLNVRALSSGSAYLATELEANNVTGGYFNYMQVLARSYPVYAKTGTTDWGTDGIQYGIPKGQMKDKWMVASTSQFTNCVWVGYDKAEAGKETYYTSYKSSLNIPGNINRLLLNKEEEIWGVPEAIPQPDDVQNSTYIYGTFPHVRPEYAQDGGGTVTALVSNSGLESMPLATVDEYLEYQASEAEYLGTKGFSAKFDQFGILTVSWSGSNGICSGGQRNIGLHDAYNDIDQWGACLADLSWLTGGGDYWGTVYIDDVPVGEISSNNGFFSGYVTDLYGEVKVCGGSTTADGSDNTACTVAQYVENPNANGYVDENGNWVEVAPDYSEYGYWDENGNWVGQGYWDANGFHLE